MSSDSRTEPRVLVLVCTYNERKNIAALVEAIGKSLLPADLLVVDDGSPDGTGDWVASQLESKPMLKLLQRGGKLGLGTAIKQGLLFGIDKGYDFVVNLDADFSHDPAVLPILVESTVKESADLTIGSRYVDGGGLRNAHGGDTLSAAPPTSVQDVWSVGRFATVAAPFDVIVPIF